MNVFRLSVLMLFLFCVTDSFSQKKSNNDLPEVLLLGLIVSEDNTEKIPYVHILNKNSKKGTISNLAGEFLIRVRQIDTLVFTAVGYEDFLFTLSGSEITSDTYSLQIALNQSTQLLSPVSIFAFKSEAAFKHDILNLELEDSKKEILIPGAFYGTPEPAQTELYFADLGLKCDGCITALVDKFRRRANEQEKVTEHGNIAARQQEIYKKYNPDIVNQITGLTGDNLVAFLGFCEIKDEFVLEANDYEIFVAVNDCFKNFLAQKN